MVITDDGSDTPSVGRRRLLRTTAGALAGAIGGGTVAGRQSERRRASAGGSFPRVSTRGHYRTTFYREVKRNDGYGPAEYELKGAIPGLTTDSQPDELTIFVHGWLNNSPIAKGTFWTVNEVLESNGYEQPLIGYSWDADTLLTRWWQATEIAERNGGKLAAFVTDYLEAAPGTTLRFVAHSLGGRVVLSTLDRLVDVGRERISSVSLLGAAVHDQEVALDGRYGQAIADGTARVDNYYAADDRILSYVYSLAEFEEAVGRGGAEGSTPGNYTDHDVTDDVFTHLGYYLPEAGCMDQVVTTFD